MLDSNRTGAEAHLSSFDIRHTFHERNNGGGYAFLLQSIAPPCRFCYNCY